MHLSDYKDSTIVPTSAVDVIVVQGSYTYKKHQTTPVLSWNMFLFLFSVHRENDIIKGYQFFWQTHWKLDNLFFSSIFFPTAK